MGRGKLTGRAGSPPVSAAGRIGRVAVSGSSTRLLEALEGLRTEVAALPFPLATAGADAARRTQSEVVEQLDD